MSNSSGSVSFFLAFLFCLHTFCRPSLLYTCIAIAWHSGTDYIEG